MVANTESMIWERAIDPEWSNLSPDVAQGLLRIRFKQADVDRMNDLAALAQEGRLDEKQRAELESYNRIGHMLAMLHSGARRALARQQG